MPGEREQRPHSRKPMPGHACAAASGRDRAAGCARACLRCASLTASSRLSAVDSSHIRGLSIVESTILGPPASLCASSRRFLGASTVDSTPIRPVFAKTASTRATLGSPNARNRRLELHKGLPAACTCGRSTGLAVRACAQNDIERRPAVRAEGARPANRKEISPRYENSKTLRFCSNSLGKRCNPKP